MDVLCEPKTKGGASRFSENLSPEPHAPEPRSSYISYLSPALQEYSLFLEEDMQSIPPVELTRASSVDSHNGNYSVSGFGGSTTTAKPLDDVCCPNNDSSFSSGNEISRSPSRTPSSIQLPADTEENAEMSIDNFGISSPHVIQSELSSTLAGRQGLLFAISRAKTWQCGKCLKRLLSERQLKYVTYLPKSHGY